MNKKIKEAQEWSKIWSKRIVKKLHPLQIRKTFKFYKSRSSKYINITKGLSKYIDSLLIAGESPESALAINTALRAERAEMFIPFSQARFLEFWVRSIGAKKVLEVGVFKGFSTAFLARAIPEDGIVFACDKDARQIGVARKFWKQMDIEDKIHFELGDALGVLTKMSADEPSVGFFDIAFIDADKENYKKYTELCMTLVRKGGVVLVDNTLWKGLVEYEDPHDNGARYIQEFNDWAFEEFGKNAVMLPAWDGVTAIFKD